MSIKAVVAFILLTATCQKPVAPPTAPVDSNPPLPPVVDAVSSCRAGVYTTALDACNTTTKFAPYYGCFFCIGGEGCISEDLAIYCVVGGCPDFACEKDVRSRRRR